MHRIHFIELEDQPWCPGTLRDTLTDFLQFALNLTRVYHPILPRLRAALARTNSRRVIDLCSGGSGPWLELHRSLAGADGQSPRVWLTDKYPNLAAFARARRLSDGALEFCTESVDASRVPADLRGFRTLFTSFHHFRPEAARALLRDAVAQRQPIGVFEAAERNGFALALMMLAPLHMLALTPFVRPFRWSRLIWTYVLPVAPLMLLFDGLVSCLRIYSLEELRAMTEEFKSANYRWEIGQESGRWPVPITYLIGFPPESDPMPMPPPLL